ncbi:AtpZ/AtpI family protein [Mucilaginibacter sp. UYCu711]|uniref:AtpZ/AtpI family protein n=1 Tax=Mucilaginibacter sp. UYCu711 TaxID=3156339 RepID=UPI003D20BA9D
MVEPENDADFFGRMISNKEKRKLNALNEKKRAEWFGLGMFGMVGWSVTAPTFLGTMGGIWLDKNYPQSFSWTVTCLILGLVAGCIIAWNWVIKEDK